MEQKKPKCPLAFRCDHYKNKTEWLCCEINGKKHFKQCQILICVKYNRYGGDYERMRQDLQRRSQEEAKYGNKNT